MAQKVAREIRAFTQAVERTQLAASKTALLVAFRRYHEADLRFFYLDKPKAAYELGRSRVAAEKQKTYDELNTAKLELGKALAEIPTTDFDGLKNSVWAASRAAAPKTGKAISILGVATIFLTTGFGMAAAIAHQIPFFSDIVTGVYSMTAVSMAGVGAFIGGLLLHHGKARKIMESIKELLDSTRNNELDRQRMAGAASAPAKE